MPSNKQLSISCSECQNEDIAPRDFQGFLRNFQNLIGAIYIVFLAPFRHLVNSLIFTQVQDRRTLPGHRGYLGLGAASQTVDAYFKTVLILNGLRGWEHLFWRQSLRVPAVPLGSGIAQPRHNTTQHDTTPTCQGVESARWTLLLAELWQVRFPWHPNSFAKFILHCVCPHWTTASFSGQ